MRGSQVFLHTATTCLYNYHKKVMGAMYMQRQFFTCFLYQKLQRNVSKRASLDFNRQNRHRRNMQKYEEE